MAGTAVVDLDCKWTYVFANATKEACAFDLKNPWHGGMNGCEVYLYSRETLPSDDSMLAPVGALEPENGVFKVDIPAESVIVLRQK